MGTKCRDCGNLNLPPRIICTECDGKRLEWHEFKGNGTLQTYTFIYTAPTFLKDKVPYAVGIAKLEEGPMITARITDADINESNSIDIGANVKIEYIQESGRNILTLRIK
ncbi:hypothetical protein A3K80_03720 [Candidatus Bathyarchaeota archaeon RBG_13_38_9]|nr:MAG: hypothetical protein A3K80_03720 [Candidatus Bathyarchaeota archaeon RBG_13_38_9]